MVNPNSSARISVQIDDAVRILAQDLGVEVDVVISPGGPPAIETDEEVVAAVEPVIDNALEHPADANVVACFSDPGISEMRATAATISAGLRYPRRAAAPRLIMCLVHPS